MIGEEVLSRLRGDRSMKGDVLGMASDKRGSFLGSLCSSSFVGLHEPCTQRGLRMIGKR